jgi:DNA-binding NarL/FixJ family response regulator
LENPVTESPALADLSAATDELEKRLVKDGRPLRVLIAEDDAVTALAFSMTIQDLGAELVGIADNARDTVKAARATRPDVVLMDIGLKGDIDGIDTAHSIRAQFAIPIIFVTGQGDFDTYTRMRDLGPTMPVLKPVSSEDIANAITRACL